MLAQEQHALEQTQGSALAEHDLLIFLPVASRGTAEHNASGLDPYAVGAAAAHELRATFGVIPDAFLVAALFAGELHGIIKRLRLTKLV